MKTSNVSGTNDSRSIQQVKNSSASSPNIFNYLNYRVFLKDFYSFKKKNSSRYSYAVFSSRAGLKSPNYLKLVMEGSRNISNENILKFAKALTLNEIETIFWENLIAFNQAKTPEQKSYYLAKLTHSPLPKDGSDSLIRVIRDEWEYFSSWHHAAIRELVLLPGFLEDPKAISDLLQKRITPIEAKDSLDLLIRLKFLVRSREGKLKQAERQVRYFDNADLKNIVIGKFHESTGKLALDSLDKDSPKDRDFSGLTIAVDKKSLPKIKKEITDFRKKLNQEYSQLKSADTVLQINFQVVPVTKGDQS